MLLSKATHAIEKQFVTERAIHTCIKNIEQNETKFTFIKT